MISMRLLAWLASALLAAGLWVLPAQAGKRLALVIGNSQYQNVTKLPNPANDAADIAAKLEELGFEVDSGIDLTQDQFDILISDFRGKIRAEKADDVVFYYAGHAFNLDGLNQFVPVDAKLKDRNLISYETVRLDRILSQIQVSDTQKTVVLLDACRNSPLPPELQDEHVGGGLAQLQTSDSTANALVVFATLPNQVTKDGKGRNSPFARALLQNMGRPGESIDEIFPDIRKQIMAETDGTQKPFKQGSPPELFYFNPDESVASNESDPPPEPMPETDQDGTDTSGSGGVPKDGALAEDAPVLHAMRPDDGDVIIGEEVGKPDEKPAPEPPEVTVENQPPVLTPESGSSVAPVAQGPVAAVRPGSGQAVTSMANPDNALSPSGAAGQLDPSKGSAGTVAPSTGTEIASNGSETLAPGSRVASIDPQQERSAVEESLDRSTIVSPGNGDDQPIDAGRSAALGGVSGKSLLESMASDVIKGVEVPDDAGTASQGPANDAGAITPQDDAAAGQGSQQQQASLETDNKVMEPPEPPAETAEGPSPELITRIQETLKDVGCFGGKADGKWGSSSQNALERYLKKREGENLEASPTQAVLDRLMEDTAGQPVCVALAPAGPKVEPKQPRPPKAQPPKPPRDPKPPKQTPKPPKPPKQPPVKPPPKKPGPIVIIGG